MLTFQADTLLPADPTSSGKRVVTLSECPQASWAPLQLSSREGGGSTQRSQGAGWVDGFDAQAAPDHAPGSAAQLGEALHTSAPRTQEGGIYDPDLLLAVRSADEKVLSRN